MTATFSTCHVCQIPVNQCVTESQNDFTNINGENITERDTSSPTRLQPGFRRYRLGLHGPWVILERSVSRIRTVVKNNSAEVSLKHYEKILAFVQNRESKTWLVF